MSWFKRGDSREVAALKGQVQALSARVAHLTIDRAEVLQLTGDTEYKGNPYTTYSSQVTELDKKFNGTADWGNQMAQNVISVRSAFTVGSGVRPVALIKDCEREMAFIRAFMDYNGIDEESAQEWVREAEIEGKFLCRLVPGDPATKMSEKTEIAGVIDARFISWCTNAYEVKTDEEDYAKYREVTYKVKKTGRDITLPESDFVYKKFGGRVDSVNETPPRLGPVLRQLEDVDKALYDWRKINSLYAAPTPVVECEDEDQAKDIWDKLKAMNWKIGKFLVLAQAKFEMKEVASGRGIDSLEKEILANAKFISGASGVPIHFLGLPDLLSNRSTADNLIEQVVSSTARERRIWVACFSEMFRKALAMANKKFGTGFNEGAIGADIPFVSAAKMRELVEVWLPLFTGGVIDIKTMVSKVPEVDSDEVLEALEERKKEEMEQEIETFNATRLPQMDRDGSFGQRTPGVRKPDPRTNHEKKKTTF